MRKRMIVILLLLVLLGIPVSRPSLAKSEDNIKTTSYGVQKKAYDTKEEVVKAVRKGLLNREKRILITMDYSVMQKFDDLNDFMEEAVRVDNSTAKDADYLWFSILGWNVSSTWIKGGEATIDMTVEYKNTAKEEKELDQKVKAVISELQLETKSDYEKVKAIHDYIINQTSYDTSLSKSSAYDSLINQSAVCEGYAMAAYRLFTEAGLKCRIISGTGNGVGHAWNIVKLDGEWYNIDLTWDDPISYDGKPMLTYDYFLKNTKDFINHKRDAKYKSKKFVASYPISKTSYVME